MLSYSKVPQVDEELSDDEKVDSILRYFKNLFLRYARKLRKIPSLSDIQALLDKGI